MIPEEKIKRAKVQLVVNNPFFGCLACYLKIREAKKGELPEWAGMGVDARGNCLYNKSFVEKISDKECESVLCHELLHVAFLHLLRLGNKIPEKWNISADLVVNYILKQNNFDLPEGCLIVNYDNSIEIFGQKIVDIDKKTPEQIYDELKFKVRKIKIGISVKGKGQGKGEEGKGDGSFDVHIYGDEEENGDGEGKRKKGKKKGEGFGKLTEEERRQLEKEWKERLAEAYVSAKSIGKVPAGIERLIGEVHRNEIDWRTILLREVQNTIPWDYTYNFPHKKSCSSGYFIPNIVKEEIDVMAVVDISGSIGKEEFTDFISEVIGIANAFRGRVKIRILTHETEINDNYLIENGNIEKIKSLEIHGGGGTAFNPVIKGINEKYPHTKLVVWLSDGFGEPLEEKRNYKIVWVLSKNGSDEYLKGDTRDRILKLKGEE